MVEDEIGVPIKHQLVMNRLCSRFSLVPSTRKVSNDVDHVVNFSSTDLDKVWHIPA